MGRDKQNEGQSDHFTKMRRLTMETPAWQALPFRAQALYPWIKLQWRGPKNNNNGKLQLSIRQAQERLGCSSDTATKAFRDLQEKGFIFVTEGATLGPEGKGQSPCFEVTEIALPYSTRPRALYLNWVQGADFPVQKAQANNPLGVNSKTKPQPKYTDGNVLNMRKTR